MQDHPNVVELIAAVQHFLEDEILPLHDDQRVRFRIRVAVNALAILQRELSAGSAAVEQEAARLRALLPASSTPPGNDEQCVDALRREIAHRIRAGEADRDPWRRAVWTATLACVRGKLLISNPRLLERHP